MPSPAWAGRSKRFGLTEILVCTTAMASFELPGSILGRLPRQSTHYRCNFCNRCTRSRFGDLLDQELVPRFKEQVKRFFEKLLNGAVLLHCQVTQLRGDGGVEIATNVLAPVVPTAWAGGGWCWLLCGLNEIQPKANGTIRGMAIPFDTLIRLFTDVRKQVVRTLPSVTGAWPGPG